TGDPTSSPPRAALPQQSRGRNLEPGSVPHDRAWRDGMSPPRPQGVGEGTAAEPGLVPHEVGEGTAAEGGGRGWISPPCKASLKGSVPHAKHGGRYRRRRRG